jgi:hypothetical protein
VVLHYFVQTQAIIVKAISSRVLKITGGASLIATVTELLLDALLLLVPLDDPVMTILELVGVIDEEVFEELALLLMLVDVDMDVEALVLVVVLVPAIDEEPELEMEMLGLKLSAATGVLKDGQLESMTKFEAAFRMAEALFGMSVTLGNGTLSVAFVNSPTRSLTYEACLASTVVMVAATVRSPSSVMYEAAPRYAMTPVSSNTAEVFKNVRTEAASFLNGPKR